MPPVVNREKCIGCEICDTNCPLDVMQMDEEGKAVCAHPDECWHCGVCRMDCPTEAIRLEFWPTFL